MSDANLAFLELIDPELADRYQELPQLLDPSLELTEIRRRREQQRAALPAYQSNPAVVSSEHHASAPDAEADVRVRVYKPAAAPLRSRLPALLYIHGGGFFMGTLDHSDPFCELVVVACDCIVISVDYRLTPATRYPGALEDCYTALRWAAANAEELEIDPARIGVGGSSAGGCLAAALALLARDRNGPQISFQYLYIPVLDDRLQTPSSHEPVAGYRVWNRQIAAKAWRAYLGDIPADAVPAYAAPARAENLADLPPAYVGVAERDILRDEAIDYAQRLMHHGVSTELQVFRGAFHASDSYLPETALSQRMIGDQLAAIRRGLGTAADGF